MTLKVPRQVSLQILLPLKFTFDTQRPQTPERTIHLLALTFSGLSKGRFHALDDRETSLADPFHHLVPISFQQLLGKPVANVETESQIYAWPPQKE